jgi:cation:H+ antiporter
MDYVIFIIALIGLMYAADVLVKGASGIALTFGLSKGFVGLTVVAAGTSMPEFFVSLVAAIEGSPDITVGNIIGSNSFNILGILGPTALIFPLAVRSLSVKLEWPIMFASIVLFYLFSRDGEIDRVEAAFFAVCFVLFLYYMFQVAKNEAKQNEPEIDAPKNILVSFGLTVAGCIGLAIGSKYMVDSAVSIAQTWNISERIIGLTIVSIGTSAPELVTNLVAAYKKESDIAVGNIIGSNIFNVIFIIGFAGMISPIKVSEAMLNFDFLVCLAASLIIFPFMINGGKINRWEGALLISGYFTYLFFMIYYR